MIKPLNRRNFLKSTSLAGFACCSFFIKGHANAMDTLHGMLEDEKTIEPEKLNYCGYVCPEDCKFLKASITNDSVLLREAYNIWDIKKKHNVDFNANNIFCFGCKNADQPEGVVLTHCTVRACAMEKGFDCCIECNELPSCDKELWEQLPKFHEQVVAIQKKYLAQKS